MATTGEAEPAVQIIAQVGGDLILEVGTPVQAKLRVFSGTLSNTSNVFGALLNGQFSEGRSTRSVELPQTISLPDDHAGGMTNMCMLLHGQVPPELFQIKAESLLQLAVVMDKYACTDFLRLQTQALLFDCLDSSAKQSPALKRSFYTQIAAAAYLLRQKRFFEMATKGLIEDAIDTGVRWPSNLPKDIVPGSIFDITEYKRIHANWKVALELPMIIAGLCVNGVIACQDNAQEGMYECFNEDGAKAWPLQARSVTFMIEAITNISKAQICTGCSNEFRESADELIGQLKHNCVGLCLHCVREGRSLKEKCDREDHK